MHRAHRCTLAGTAWARPAPTGPWPTVARFQGARRAAPPSPPRAAARFTRPTIPRAPRPRIRPTARAPALRPLRLHRLHAAPGCPRPSMSPSNRSRIVVWVVAIGKSRAHRPHRARRAPPLASLSRVASAPGPWLARIAPYASLFRRMREKGPLPGNIRPKCMLFEIKMATSSPYASIPGRNRAIRDAWRANLAAKGPLSRRGARNHAWREDVASAARPFRGSGLRSGRMGFAPCGAGLACLPHARPLPSRLCPPPPAFIAAVLYASRFAARIAPTHAAIRRAAHCGRDELSIGLFLPPSCCPHRYISLPERRTHLASRADPPRPGNKRNSTNNSMRA